MRWRRSWIGLVSLACLHAQSGEPPDVLRAREELTRVRALVEAGALPASRLQQARETLDEASDEAILRRTLYGSISVEDLTEQRAAEMVGAARRRLERHAPKIERARKLIDEGAASRLSLAPLLEEAARRRRVFDLAESRGRLVHELAGMARAEHALQEKLRQSPTEAPGLAERFDGRGMFRSEDLKMIQLAFEGRFARPLPISANGETAVHRELGFDHRGRVDVAVDPDQPEGIWLRRMLQDAGIPYFAFRSAVPGKATAPHIHIGPPSERLGSGG